MLANYLSGESGNICFLVGRNGMIFGRRKFRIPQRLVRDAMYVGMIKCISIFYGCSGEAHYKAALPAVRFTGTNGTFLLFRDEATISGQTLQATANCTAPPSFSNPNAHLKRNNNRKPRRTSSWLKLLG
jgi:hypothetical protein